MSLLQGNNSFVTGDLIQIYWHNKLPIFSIDINHSCEKLRFATGGADSNARIWEFDDQTGEIQFIATLSKHTRALNCVRWSPSTAQQSESAFLNGSLLATGGDGGSLFLWHQISTDLTSSPSTIMDDSLLFGEDESEISKEIWKVRSNLETNNPFDIFALEWSFCGRYIATGTSDDSVRIYSVKEGQCIKVIRDHSHFVNGICWDPLGKFLISISSDRSVKVNKLLGGSSFRSQCLCKISKFIRRPQDCKNISDEDAVNISHAMDGFKLFEDESLISFFRKGTFTPDGAYLYLPAGLTEDNRHCVHVFIRNGFTIGNPIFSIGGFEKSPIGIFFCHQKMHCLIIDDCQTGNLTENCKIEQNEYCWLFCILTTDKIYIFQTGKCQSPLAIMQNYHLTTLTDACWKCNGRELLVTSCDGFVSHYTFDWNGIFAPFISSSQNSSVSSDGIEMKKSEIQNNNQSSNEMVIINSIENNSDLNSGITNNSQLSDISNSQYNFELIVESNLCSLATPNVMLENQISKPATANKKRISPVFVGPSK